MQEVTITRDSLFTVADVAVIKPDDNSVQIKKVMGENLLNISFEDNRYIPFAINDYCTVFGERYNLNQLPVVTKVSRFLYKYSMQLQAAAYDLAKAQYLFLGSDNSLRESDFSLMGTASDFIDLLLLNMARVGSGWTKGQVIDTGYKNITFSAESCSSALARIAEEFETEFAIEGKVIHLTRRTNDTGYTYRHGRNKGLYELTRSNLNNSSIVTRLYAYGSEKNLPPGYATNGKRLRFPGGYNPCLISNLTVAIVDNDPVLTKTYTFTFTLPLTPSFEGVGIEYREIGTTTWITSPGISNVTPRVLTLPTGDYEFRFRTLGNACNPATGTVTDAVDCTNEITTPVFVYTPLPFIERNVNKYGVIEYTEIFDDIYPHRTGVVSGVNISDPQEFTDSDIDFNVNDYLLPGLTAKVTFNTGQLAGYTFEIASFDNSLKRFKINKNADERLLDLPSALIKPAIGDQYVLTDIEMPTSYVTNAEAELLAAANARLIELSEPQLAYNMVLDPVYIRQSNRRPAIGDLVWIVDTELEVQRKIRVISVTRNIVREDQYQAEIADIVSPGTIQRIISSNEANGRDINGITNQLLNNSVLNGNIVGTLTFQNIPTTPTLTGFEAIVIETATGKLYKKV